MTDLNLELMYFAHIAKKQFPDEWENAKHCFPNDRMMQEHLAAECAYIMTFNALPAWVQIIDFFESYNDGGYLFVHRDLKA